MKQKVQQLNPNEFLESFMRFGSKRNDLFKSGFELFYIARMEDLTDISNTPIPPVKAETHTLFFLTSGMLAMKIGSQTIQVHQNECLIIPAGQVFSYSDALIEKSEQGQGFICGFNDDFLIGQIGSRDLLKTYEFLTIWGNPVIQAKGEAATYLTHSLSRILAEYTKSGLQNKFIIQAYLIAILCDLNMDYVPLSKHHNKTAVELTNRFKELLHQHINTSTASTRFPILRRCYTSALTTLIKPSN